MADLYDTDNTKIPDDQIDKWITEKSFYYFEKNVTGIDEISIRQISRVRTKLRRRTNELRDTGRINCEVMGLSFYHYKLLHGEKRINRNTKLRLVQETENLYDEFAVRVETIEGDKIGYIPSIYAEEVYDYIEADQNLNTSIISLASRKLELKVSVHE